MEKTFSLKGKIIGETNKPLSDLKVLAYDKDPLLNPDDFLGDSTTDDNGFFFIGFDKSKFVDFAEIIEGRPDIFLVIKDKDNREILKTRVMKTRKEIEYNLKVAQSIPDPHAPDIYSGNAKRMLNFLTAIGNIIDLEYNENKDILNGPEISDKSKEISHEFIDNYDQIKDNFDNLLVISSSLIHNYLKELDLSPIQYDGPQVPRFPHKTKYNQVISWPRDENFKWE